MSAIRYNRNGVSISTFAGPERYKSPNSNSRNMVQICSNTSITPDLNFVVLSNDQWIDLICFIREMDARNEGITSVPEVEG